MKKTKYIIIILLFIFIFYKLYGNPKDLYFSKNLTFYIISINDETYKVNIEGSIDYKHNNVVKIPYNIPLTKKINLDAYEERLTLDSNLSSEKEEDVHIIFSYPPQYQLTGKGYINANLRIDDMTNKKSDDKFRTKQLKINESDYLLAKFKYPIYPSEDEYGTLEVKVTSGIKNPNDDFIYYPIVSPTTGRTWLNNNLGAEYSRINNFSTTKNPFKQANSFYDKNAYGKLYRWNGEDSTIKLCPKGWRLPYVYEFTEEFDKSNFLKLTMAGYRLYKNDPIFSKDFYGAYWTIEEDKLDAYFFLFDHFGNNYGEIHKAGELSVRCIQD